MSFTSKYAVSTNGKETYELVVTDGRARCYTMGGDEVAKELNFAPSAWVGCPDKCMNAMSLPVIEVSTQPIKIPESLTQLSDDAKVVVRDEIAQYDVVSTAGGIRAKLQERIERQSRKLFTSHEVAALIHRNAARMLGPIFSESLSDTFDSMAHAFSTGRLKAFDESSLRRKRPEEIIPFYEKNGLSRSAAQYAIHWALFTLDMVDAWLEDEAPYRVSTSSEVVEPNSAPSASPQNAGQPGAQDSASVSPAPGSVNAGGRRRNEPTVQDAIAPYVAQVMQKHPDYTAEKLQSHMKREAGQDKSPFSRRNYGEDLFCTEAGKACGLSSVRAALTIYRKTLPSRRSSTVEVPSNP